MVKPGVGVSSNRVGRRVRRRVRRVLQYLFFPASPRVLPRWSLHMDDTAIVGYALRGGISILVGYRSFSCPEHIDWFFSIQLWQCHGMATAGLDTLGISELLCKNGQWWLDG